jgi:hypothetical protein
MTSHMPQLLERASRVLPASSDELLLRGITAETTDRIVALKQASLRLRAQYGSIENLEEQMECTGVSPDDHHLYTDLLEWRAIRHEVAELVDLLASL